MRSSSRSYQLIPSTLVVVEWHKITQRLWGNQSYRVHFTSLAVPPKTSPTPRPLMRQCVSRSVPLPPTPLLNHSQTTLSQPFPPLSLTTTLPRLPSLRKEPSHQTNPTPSPLLTKPPPSSAPSSSLQQPSRQPPSPTPRPMMRWCVGRLVPLPPFARKSQCLFTEN